MGFYKQMREMTMNRQSIICGLNEIKYQTERGVQGTIQRHVWVLHNIFPSGTPTHPTDAI